MKKISKQNFIKKITNGESVFIGISPVIEIAECKRRIAEANKRLAEGRTCKNTSGMRLKFSDESYLSLADNSEADLTIECYEEDSILVVSQTWICRSWDGEIEETRTKNLHYAMV